MTDANNQAQPKFIDRIASNFGSISTIITAIAAILSIVFLFAYLTVFDAYLIMMIEYTDLLKFMLIGIVIVFGLITFFDNVMYTLIDWYVHGKYSKTHAMIIVSLTVLVPIVIAIIGLLQRQNVTMYQFLRSGCIILALLTTYMIAKLYKEKTALTIRVLYGSTLIISSLTYLIGATYGVYVRDLGANHDVIIRESDTKFRAISDAKLVLFTSHHVILKIGPSIATFPTAIVQEIRSDAP